MHWLVALFCLVSFSVTASLGPRGGMGAPDPRPSKASKKDAKVSCDTILLTTDNLGLEGAWSDANHLAFFKEHPTALAVIIEAVTAANSVFFNPERELRDDGYALARTYLKMLPHHMGTPPLVPVTSFQLVRAFTKKKKTVYVGGNVSLQMNPDNLFATLGTCERVSEKQRIATVERLIGTLNVVLKSAAPAPAPVGKTIKALAKELRAFNALVPYGNTTPYEAEAYDPTSFRQTEMAAELKEVLEEPYQRVAERDGIKYSYAIDWTEARAALDKPPFEYLLVEDVDKELVATLDRWREEGILQGFAVGWLSGVKMQRSYSLIGMAVYLSPAPGAKEGLKLVFPADHGD